ncbi:MAG: glycosyltransferase family 2 protein [Sulfobacillus sp.]
MPSRLSVVIPVHNGLATIGEAIASALAQTHLADEVVVVNDGSTDGTADLVRGRFPSVRLIEQPQSGPASARNTGIEAASGDWVAFLDADDVWLPRKLELQMAAAERAPAALMIGSGWAALGSEPAHISYQDAISLDFRQILLGYFLGPSGVVADRRALLAVGGFRPDREGIEDRDLWCRLAQRGSVLFYPQALWIYRRTPTSFSRVRMRGFEAGRRLMADMRPYVQTQWGDGTWQTVLAAVALRYRAYFEQDQDPEGVRLCNEMLAQIPPRWRRQATLRLVLPYWAARARHRLSQRDGFWFEPLPSLSAFGPSNPGGA